VHSKVSLNKPAPLNYLEMTSRMPGEVDLSIKWNSGYLDIDPFHHPEAELKVTPKYPAKLVGNETSRMPGKADLSIRWSGGHLEFDLSYKLHTRLYSTLTL